MSPPRSVAAAVSLGFALVLCQQTALAQSEWQYLSNNASSRNAHAMVYDLQRRCIVMFGGDGLNFTEAMETWEWSNRQWRVRTSVTSPPGRMLQAMVYDPIRSRVVMFGGLDFMTTLGDDRERARVDRLQRRRRANRRALSA